MKHKLLFFLFLVVSPVFGQQQLESSDAISDCTGAVNILKTGEYRMQFPGKGGKVNDFSAYTSLKELDERNTLFC